MQTAAFKQTAKPGRAASGMALLAALLGRGLQGAIDTVADIGKLVSQQEQQDSPSLALLAISPELYPVYHANLGCQHSSRQQHSIHGGDPSRLG